MGCVCVGKLTPPTLTGRPTQPSSHASPVPPLPPSLNLQAPPAPAAWPAWACSPWSPPTWALGTTGRPRGASSASHTIRHTKPVKLGWLRYAYSGASPTARLETLADALRSAEAAAGHPESEHYLVPRKEYGPHTVSRGCGVNTT